MKIRFRDFAVSRFPSFHHEHPTYRWWVLINILLATFVSVLQSTAENTALPKMQASLGANLDTIQWVLTSFSLIYVVALAISGWLADKFGYKRTFFAALAFFTLGCFLCANAWNVESLIAFRVIQGFGGGMLMPVGMAVIMREFPPDKRGVAMGFYGIAAAASISIGPSIGGFLTDTYGWRSIFLFSIPFGMLTMFATLVIQREVKSKNAGDFDFPGFITISIFLVSLILALSDGNASWNLGGWTSPLILTCFGISLFSFLAFLLIELRSPRPLINLELFKDWNFAMSNIILFILGLILQGSTFVFPVYLQNTLGYSALQAGMMYLPQGLIQGAASPVSGILADRFNPKVPAFIGLAAVILSFWLNTMLTTVPPGWMLILPICLRGLGFGLFFVAIQAVSVNSLPRDKLARGSAMISLMRQIGASFGVAIFGAFVTNRNTFHAMTTGENLDRYSETFVLAASQLKGILSSQGGLPSGTASTVSSSLIVSQVRVDAYVQAVNDVFIIATLLVVVCCLPVFLLRTKKAPHAAHAQDGSGDSSQEGHHAAVMME